MRSLLNGALAAAVLGLAGILSPALADTVVVSNWDGYMPKDIAQRFKAATGHDLEVKVHASNEEVLGQVIAGKGAGMDVLFVSAPYAQQLYNLGLADTLDHAKLPNLKNLYPEAVALKHDPGNQFSVPYTWGTTGLCYRSDLTSEPKSWNDLLKPSAALKGKVTMLDTDRWLLAAGLLAQKLSVNETDRAKLDATKALLIEAKKGLLSFDTTTFYTKLVSGQAKMVQAWDGWCNYGITENDKIKYVIPLEGSDLWADTIVIVASSAHKEAAHAFVNFMLEPEIGKWVVENVLYKVPNKAAMDKLDPALIKKYPSLGIPPSELDRYEELVDVGPALKDYARVVAEVQSAK